MFTQVESKTIEIINKLHNWVKANKSDKTLTEQSIGFNISFSDIELAVKEIENNKTVISGQ